MFTNSYVFTQLIAGLPRRELERCVARYAGEYYAKSLTCREQFLALAFGQLAQRESLRDIVTCLRSHASKQYHLGFRAPVARSTLADANERRDWQIYRDLAEILIGIAQQHYADEPDITSDVAGACYAIDATSLDLCLALCPWAPYVASKASVKLHTMLDLRGAIPACFDITGGKVSDMSFLDQLAFEAGAFYVMDRGYLDYGRLYALHTAGGFFVTRTKRNTRLKRRYSYPRDRAAGIQSDHVVYLTGSVGAQKYPDTLRRITYTDASTGHTYIFLTNNHQVSASSIALLYKHRWQIELFFKWIKQHLRIKTFWGYSENAVKTQICIALCTYLLVAILKKQLGIERNLYEILQILSVSLFDKTGLVELFSDTAPPENGDGAENMVLPWDF